MNIWAIIVSVAFAMALGMWWYSPAGFGNAWMRAMKITPAMVAKYKKQNKSMAKEYTIVIITALLSTLILGCVIKQLGITSAVHGAGIGALLAVGFNALPNVSQVIFEQRPKVTYWINTGYNVVLFAVIGAILAGWR